MNDSTIKRLAGLNGKAIKKTVSMTKTLTAGDDNATVELVQQLGSVVGEMADVLKRHEGIATSQAGMPVSCAVPKEIPENVILDKIAAVATADYDVHKVIRNNGCVTAYFEPTACSNAVESDIDACKKIVADAGMQSVNARLVDDGMAIAVTLVQDAYGNPLLDASGDDEEFEDDDVGDIEGDDAIREYDPSVKSVIPTREKMLEIITHVVARAIDVVNRHVVDKNPSVRKLESAVGFKDDLKFLMKRRFADGSNERAQARIVYNAIKRLEDVLDGAEVSYMEQVPAYLA